MREFCFFCYLLSYYENIIKSQNVLWKNIYIWFWHFLYKMRAKIRKKSNFGKPHGLSQKTNINNFLTFWSYEEQERNVKKKLILDFEVWTCRHCTHSYTHNKYYLVLNTSIFFHFGPTVRCDNLSAEAIVFKFRNIMRTEDTLFHKLSVVCRAANQGKKYRGKCHKYYGRYLLNWCFAFKT